MNYVATMAAIALMVCSALVNAEITAVVDGNFEAVGGCGYGNQAPWDTEGSAWIGVGTIFMDTDATYPTIGEDRGPGVLDQNWLTLWEIPSGTAKAYQDLGTTEATGFYVAQAIMQRHLTADYDISPFKFCLRDSGTDAELASSGLTELFWVVPGADQRSLTPPYLLAEVTFQATSATALRVQLESVPSTLSLARLGVDDVRVVNELLGANTPNPNRWTTGVSYAATLSWTTGSTAGIDGHNVYLGTDPELLTLQNGTPLALGTTTYSPTLAKDTIYYWRVDEVDSIGNVLVTGNVWAFQTELSLPEIDTQPADAVGAEGGNVDLTVVATDPLSGILSYQWYIDPNTANPPDPDHDDELANGADYSGVKTDTLTILGLSEADAGKLYYCKVSNVAGDTLTDTATVNFPRLVYYWPFEDSTNDAKGLATLNTAYGTPTFGAGVVGNALILSDDTTGNNGSVAYDNVVPLFNPDTLAPVAAERGQSTISFWAKSEDVTLFADSYFSRDNWNSLWFGQISASGGIRTRYYPQFATGHIFDHNQDFEAGLVNGQWYHMAVRYSIGEVALFIDGVPFAKIDLGPGGGVIQYDGAQLFNIGKHGNISYWFYGAIDEFKIYNYPLSDAEIAQEYTDGSGVAVCLDAATNIVIDGNCVTDLADFAALAADWLKEHYTTTP